MADESVGVKSKPITYAEWAATFVPPIVLIDPQTVADRKSEAAHRDFLLGR